ncbi:Ribokinase-like protein [Rickenella mellea]|uniref:pyridoxal kinase n=1 Tax=Rickenella mellea TaxID=50990 RepID=A0A4Y7QHB5_9AGAM|nr:Ribokinase-like protein [Rickenella mellea]
MNGRVLSIQSHVAYGYVGNKAAVFPLQCLDYDVDVVNTVNFSNHSGYGHFGGSKASADELRKIFRLMEDNGMLTPHRLVTGYIPGAEALSAVAELAKKLRARRRDMIYLLDPVLGDSGKLYVSQDVIPIYKSMLPLSTIITPNWFEVETLTDQKIADMPSLRRALTILHEEHEVPHVVISSITLTPFLRAALPSSIRPPEDADNEDYLLCISSSSSRGEEGSQSQMSVVHAQCMPFISGYYSGVGDLFSALVLAHFSPSPPSPSPHLPTTTNGVSAPTQNGVDSAALPHPYTSTPLSRATSAALTTTHAILQDTATHAQTLPLDSRTSTDDELDNKEPARVVRRMRGRELRIVHGQDVIRQQRAVPRRTMELWVDFWDA